MQAKQSARTIFKVEGLPNEPIRHVFKIEPAYLTKWLTKWGDRIFSDPSILWVIYILRIEARVRYEQRFGIFRTLEINGDWKLNLPCVRLWLNKVTDMAEDHGIICYLVGVSALAFYGAERMRNVFLLCQWYISQLTCTKLSTERTYLRSGGTNIFSWTGITIWCGQSEWIGGFVVLEMEQLQA